MKKILLSAIGIVAASAFYPRIKPPTMKGYFSLWDDYFAQ